jgi:predicted acylesterase/phospholipase RssA
VFVLSTRGKNTGPIKLFRSYGIYRDECLIWQAARATTAAPTYFSPASVTVPSPPEWYIYGGVTHNNPSPFALKEGKKLWKANRCLLVSVGMGIQKRADSIRNKITPKDDSGTMNNPPITAGPVDSRQSVEGTSDAGSTQSQKPKFGRIKLGLQKGAFGKVASLFRPIADKAAQLGQFPGELSTATQFFQEQVKLSTQSEKTHRTMYAEAHSNDLSTRFPYYRFNVQNGMYDIGLEEWRNWDLVVVLTRNYLDSVDVAARLTKCAGDLLHPPGFEGMLNHIAPA